MQFPYNWKLSPSSVYNQMCLIIKPVNEMFSINFYSFFSVANIYQGLLNSSFGQKVLSRLHILVVTIHGTINQSQICDNLNIEP